MLHSRFQAHTVALQMTAFIPIHLLHFEDPSSVYHTHYLSPESIHPHFKPHTPSVSSLGHHAPSYSCKATRPRPFPKTALSFLPICITHHHLPPSFPNIPKQTLPPSPELTIPLSPYITPPLLPTPHPPLPPPTQTILPKPSEHYDLLQNLIFHWHISHSLANRYFDNITIIIEYQGLSIAVSDKYLWYTYGHVEW